LEDAMSDYAEYLDAITMPARIRALPIDPILRVPVPWFVARAQREKTLELIPA
jgi:hypothetical protein